MFFNKLYNLILENIINQNKATRKQMLAKLQNHQQIQDFLNQLANKGKVESKAADFLAKYFKSKQLTNTTDKKINQVVDVLNRVPNYNIQINITLDKFLEQNQKYLTRDLKQNTKDIIAYIDTNYKNIFTQKKQYSNGVVIYKVNQSRQGQAAVRKIIDICLGDNWNPWCLASRQRGGLQKNYNDYWIGNYTAFPKHIAFQNGQLLAFCADNHGNCTWWNREDKESEELQLLDGSYMQTEKYEWSLEEKRQIFVIRHNLTYNKRTKRYDKKGNVFILDKELINGSFPVPLGTITGNFSCKNCPSLTSLQNAPTKVKKDSDFKGCINMPGYRDYMKNIFITKHKLILNQQTGLYDCNFDVKIDNSEIFKHYFIVNFGTIKGNFDCSYCTSLTSFEGAPKYVSQDFNCKYCTNLKNSDDLPNFIGGKIYYDGCPKNFIESQVFKKYTNNIIEKFIKKSKIKFNQQTQCYDSDSNVEITTDVLVQNGKLILSFGIIKGNFEISYCDKLTSLKGVPKEVGGDYIISSCNGLTSLQFSPKIIGGDFICTSLSNLKAIGCATQKVGGDVKIKYCENLKTLHGSPIEVKGNYIIDTCRHLPLLKGITKNISGKVCIRNCRNLIIDQEKKQRYKIVTRF